MLASLFALVIQSSQKDYTQDLKSFIDTVKSNGAYVVEDKIDFAALEKAYLPRFKSITNQTEALRVIEDLVGELHDFHAALGTNDDLSPKLVPAGTDVQAVWRGEKAYIWRVRSNSPFSKQHKQEFRQVLSIDGVPIRKAAMLRFGVRPPDERGWDWALNSVLAGQGDAVRQIEVTNGVDKKTISLPPFQAPQYKTRLTVEVRPNGELYLRPEDCLYDYELIKEFDRFVPQMQNSKRIILDLTNTPSGGNTSVARAIMGLFIDKRLPHQRHRVEERDTGTVRDWVEYVTPRLTKPIRKDLTIVVDPWTGSMGEGLAIGFDAIGRGRVSGAGMAGLRGAISNYELPVSGFRYFFPTEQLFHIDGTPRHKWVPLAQWATEP